MVIRDHFEKYVPCTLPIMQEVVGSCTRRKNAYVEMMDLQSIFEGHSGILNHDMVSNVIFASEKGFKKAANSGSLIGHPIDNIWIVLMDGVS